MRYQIIAPVKEYNGITAGVPFHSGTAIVSESEAMEKQKWFSRRGYIIKEMEEDPAGNKRQEDIELEKQKNTDHPAKKIANMKTKELESYAAELGVDLTGCTNNDQRRERITAHLAEDYQEEDGSEDEELEDPSLKGSDEE